MAAGAYVQLLGQPGVRVDGKAIDFLPNKRFQLLAYLAYQNDWVSRDKLAFLFWADETDHTARHNLRQLLKYLRKMDWLSELEADENRLRWQVETDLASLIEALRDGDVEKMLSLYQGPLLPNLEGREEGEFGDWLAMEREGLHGRWREALLSKVVELESSDQYDLASQLLRTLLERDPLDEEGLQVYMRSAAHAGNREQALSAYRAFAKHLQAELGMEPTSATQQLAQEIERAASMPLPSRETTVSIEPVAVPKQTPPLTTATSLAPSLPKPATSFVGRDLELAELMYLLSQEDCRLLTLTGAGGIGKTRLALQVAQESYPDGVYFVPLDALSSAASIPASIAAALGLGLEGHGEPLAQIVVFLKDKHVLLVLDNFEHLLEGATLASELLQGCPNVKLLVTSRERLNLEEEWLLPVEGLSYPVDAGDLEKASAHDAVQLFLERAKRSQPGFALTSEELPHVLEVCRLVWGFPLGIELAATWVRAVPVAEIAKEIGRDYDFLSSTSRNVKDRHRSIRAAFEYSWRLLSPVEQKVLQELSVFRGGFRKEAASYVADASYAVLAALVDKSLLSISPNGRYDCHPLVYQYTQEKLMEDPKEAQEVRERHGLFFLHVLEEWNIAIRSGTPGPCPAPRADLENICAAWEWLVPEVRLREIKRMSYFLQTFLAHCMQHTRAVKMLTGTLEALDENDPEHRPVIGSVMVCLTWSYHMLGDGERAQQLAQKSIELLHPTVDSFERHRVWQAWLGLGHTALSVGDWSEAQLHYKQALIQAPRVPHIITGKATDGYLNLTLAMMALVAQNSGDYLQAEQCYRELGKTAMVLDAALLNNYGEFLLLTDQLDEAIRIYREGLHRAHEEEDHVVAATSLSRLALAYCKLGEFDQARTYCEQGLAANVVIREGPLLRDVSPVLICLGRALTALSEYEQAREQFREALRFAWGCREVPFVLYALVGLAELEAKRGCEERAVRLLSVIIHYPSHSRESRDLGREVLETLHQSLSGGGVKGEGGVSDPEGLERIVKDVLAWT